MSNVCRNSQCDRNSFLIRTIRNSMCIVHEAHNGITYALKNGKNYIMYNVHKY